MGKFVNNGLSLGKEVGFLAKFPAANEKINLH